MIRTLQGQSPMIQSILVGPATKNFDEIKQILGEDCDRNSTGWDNPGMDKCCLLYTSPSPRDATLSRMPSSA